MNQIANPYSVFSLNPDMNSQEIKGALLEYKANIDALYNLYQTYFSMVGTRGTENASAIRERAENILSRRYEFGLNLDKLWLDSKETKDLLSKIAHVKGISISDEETVEPGEELLEAGKPQELHVAEGKMRLELFDLTFKDVLETKESIEKAIKSRDNDKNDDIESMLDLLISLRYKGLLVSIADSLATNLSQNGIIQSREEFLETLKSTKSYQQLCSIYEQVATQEKRSELIPKFYIRKNMADMSQFSTVDGDTVERLLKREDRYKREYIDSIIDAYIDPEEGRRNEVAENQNHDYAWGIVLTAPQTLMDNEVVNSPIFKGRITVEKLGAFSEHSLFRKRKYEREYTVRVRERAQLKQGQFQKRLDRAPSQRTMREYFYRHEACKVLSDNILRIIKTDTQGRSKTHIIFSPLENVGRRGSDLSEFIKNVYLSDYMLEMAERNGGYAGRIMQNDNGFFIANRYNYEEIASAILFQHGQKGDILDHRDTKHREKHTDVTKDKFLELVTQRERVKEFNE